MKINSRGIIKFFAKFNSKTISHRSIIFASLLCGLLSSQWTYSQPDFINSELTKAKTLEYSGHFINDNIDAFTVMPNSAHVHRVQYDNNEKHQFQLVSVFPLTRGGRVTYQTDAVSTEDSPFLDRRLAVINKSNISVDFRLNIKPLSLTEFEHTEVLNKSKMVVAKGVSGFHLEGTDKHEYYLASVYPTTPNARLMYEWDNVRDPGSSGFIRRLVVVNKSNFPVEFEIKVIKIGAQTASNIGIRKSGLVKTEKLNKTSTVSANSQHGFHFEQKNVHAFYLTSVYPITEHGRLTYEWDNVRDPGTSGFIRRLVVINKSNFPVEFKLKVTEVEAVRGILDHNMGNAPVTELTTDGNTNNSSDITAIESRKADNGISFPCLNAGDNMDRCHHISAAIGCAQMACQLEQTMDAGDRFTMQKQYDVAMCNTFEKFCGFGGGGSGGSGGGPNRVKCSWSDIGCRIVHTGNDNWWF